MDLRELAGLSTLMIRLAGKPPGSFLSPTVTRKQGQTTSGTVFAIYRHRRKNRAAWIIVHGITINGKEEPRLIHFAHCLARSGVTCVVPTLPGLASCRWELSDLEALSELIVTLSNETCKPVGLIGFSYGGSYCLVAAGREEVADHVGQVIGFGAYHNMNVLFDDYKKKLGCQPTKDDEWDDVIYRCLVLVYGYGGETFLSPGARQEMESLLHRYCSDASPEEKQRFYRKYLQKVDISELIQRVNAPGVFRQLSPAKNLSGLTCPVTLIHQRDDPVIPPGHSQAIYKELLLLPNREKHRLVITSLLSHVSPARGLHVRDVIRFSLALKPIFCLHPTTWGGNAGGQTFY